MLFGDESIIMVERLDVHLFVWKQKGRYIINSYPRPAYALHILNCRHEYGNTDDAMTLLKQINHQFNIQEFYVLFAQCIYVFCVDLRTNSDISLYNIY